VSDANEFEGLNNQAAQLIVISDLVCAMAAQTWKPEQIEAWKAMARENMAAVGTLGYDMSAENRQIELVGDKIASFMRAFGKI